MDKEDVNFGMGRFIIRNEDYYMATNALNKVTSLPSYDSSG
jgi:hypothetical protein